MSVLYHSNKANVVAEALSHMTMGSVSHIEEAKKDIVKDVHRLARLVVRLDDSQNSGFMVHHNSESSLVVEVKSKQHLDQPLMELKNRFMVSLMSHPPKGEEWCLKVSSKVVCSQCRWFEEPNT